MREDYSAGGNAWDYFSHDQARSRAYRWGEDGLAGLSDPEQKLCFSLALWNHQDPILKERLFGLTNSEGNHGEDVKEYYYYLDNTPTHSYMKWLYKYPQAAYPYQDLVAENGRRKGDPHSMEYELINTGVFDDDRYFDVGVEYAKAGTHDVLIKISITNHGPDAAPLTVLPTLWFRNTWSWFPGTTPPQIHGTKANTNQAFATLVATPAAGETDPVMTLYCQATQDLFFTNNETNSQKLFNAQNASSFVKDGINDHVLTGAATLNPALEGTKASAAYALQLPAGATQEIFLRLSSDGGMSDPFGNDFGQVFSTRITEADEFYNSIAPAHLTDEQKMIQRQAYAGMLWSKQFYNYIVADWLDGDPAGPPPPAGRGRNASWRHLYASNILSMPDAWEYPWFAAWDLCFQTIVFARIDLEFAKQQLLILSREWYMGPDGDIPAYEWAFSDVNPPLHAWAALHLYKLEKEKTGGDGDRAFLKEIFQSCLMNFTWWANRESSDGTDLFEGGFLGLDNISIINRSNLGDFENQIGRAVTLKQSDGTSWMGMFSL
ncbi:MAG: glucosidase, partial [Bacteroidota bacterium]